VTAQCVLSRLLEAAVWPVSARPDLALLVVWDGEQRRAFAIVGGWVCRVPANLSSRNEISYPFEGIVGLVTCDDVSFRHAHRGHPGPTPATATGQPLAGRAPRRDPATRDRTARGGRALKANRTQPGSHRGRAGCRPDVDRTAARYCSGHHPVLDFRCHSGAVRTGPGVRQSTRGDTWVAL
jgi:hypothetical protein